MTIEPSSDVTNSLLVRLTELKTGKQCTMVGIADEGRNRPADAPPITEFYCEVDERETNKQRAVVKRLCDLGLTPGTVFTKVRGHNGGPVLIEVRDTKLALGHGLANKILVEEYN
jgi:Fe2+ transport system protein FeoA